MQCPICKADLTPLDVGSRLEHVDFCLENGPSTIEVNESGGVVIKKTIDPKKQRKICPICDKTFQQLHSHFKTCALKNDVPPDLMLDYWEKINEVSKTDKKFPRDLLDNFVAKCIKEGRIGAQVDFARALSLSMAGDTVNNPITSTDTNSNEISRLNETRVDSDVISSTDISETTVISSTHTIKGAEQASVNLAEVEIGQVLMRNSNTKSGTSTKSRSKSQAKTYRLQNVDDAVKRSNIELRINRELAASNSKRYRETVALSKATVLRNSCDSNDDDDDCVILLEPPDCSSQIDCDRLADEMNKLFHRARLKKCDGSSLCADCKCENHDLELILEEFQNYTGKSIDVPQRVELGETAARLAGEMHDERKILDRPVAAEAATDECEEADSCAHD